MRKVNQDNAPGARLRRRDLFSVVLASAVVLFVLSVVGNLTLIEAIMGSLTVFALATIYHLTVSSGLRAADARIQTQNEPSDESPRPIRLGRTMLDHLPIPVLLIGADGKIETSNPAAREFLSLGNEGGYLSAAIRQPEVLNAVNLALKGEGSDPIEYSSLLPDEVHVRAFVSPLKTVENQTNWQAMLALTDETSLKRADRMRADFLANASHELRTPLSSLAGFIETLSGHAKDDEEARARFLAIMQEQTDRMRRLIDDLLVLSRVEMDEYVAPQGRVDLSAIIEEVIEFLRPQIQKRYVELEAFNLTEAHVVGDRDQILEVIQNLLENAIKYSPVGSKVRIEMRSGLSRNDAERPQAILSQEASRLTLAAPPLEAGTRYVSVRIWDEGQGIDRNNLPRLSERFYRVDGQKSGPKEGTGLGLAIVKHIINRHRGGFTVESALGVGSVFSVFLPCRDADQE